MTSQTSMDNRQEPRDTVSNPRGYLTEAAYDFMKDRLLEGGYGPGDRISTEQVMEAIGASRQPVMDAMRRLAVEGFVKVVPQVGCLVATPDPRDITDFLRMLASIEATCIELAVLRATDDEILRLQQIVADFKGHLVPGASSSELAHAYRLHNREFHHYLYSIAHSPTVSDVAVSLSDRADFYIANASGTLTFGVRFADAVEEHRRIAEVLSWRQPELARMTIGSHVLAFIDSMQNERGAAKENPAE